MAFHFIAVLNDYVHGHRIGWHYASIDKLDKEYIKTFLETVEEQCGDVQLGIHKLSTSSIEWKSVVEKDSFFEDIIITPSTEHFIKQIKTGKELTAYDVSKFILSVLPVSHLKLQKLLYYAYSEFLIQTGKKLFKEPIVAFKYGPVVEDVFYKFRHHGSSHIDYKEDEVFFIHAAEASFTPSFVRILSSEDGLTANDCILNIIKRYMHTSASELVDKTHKIGGPWARVYIPGSNCPITDELIKKYHYVVQ